MMFADYREFVQRLTVDIRHARFLREQIRSQRFRHIVNMMCHQRLRAALLLQSLEIIDGVSQLCEGHVHKDIDQTNHSLFSKCLPVAGF